MAALAPVDRERFSVGKKLITKQCFHGYEDDRDPPFTVYDFWSITKTTEKYIFVQLFQKELVETRTKMKERQIMREEKSILKLVKRLDRPAMVRGKPIVLQLTAKDIQQGWKRIELLKDRCQLFWDVPPKISPEPFGGRFGGDDNATSAVTCMGEAHIVVMLQRAGGDIVGLLPSTREVLRIPKTQIPTSITAMSLRASMESADVLKQPPLLGNDAIKLFNGSNELLLSDGKIINDLDSITATFCREVKLQNDDQALKHGIISMDYAVDTRDDYIGVDDSGRRITERSWIVKRGEQEGNERDKSVLAESSQAVKKISALKITKKDVNESVGKSMASGMNKSMTKVMKKPAAVRMKKPAAGVTEKSIVRKSTK